jgi:hypothetical protein
MTEVLRYANIVLAALVLGAMIRETAKMWPQISVAVRLRRLAYGLLLVSVAAGTALVLLGVPDRFRVVLVTIALGFGVVAYSLDEPGRPT